MDRLTPLERELMACVDGLIDGFRSEMRAFQGGLKSYEARSGSAYAKHLDAIERVQKSLGERMATIESNQLRMERQLSEVSQICAKQLSTYEKRIESLVQALKRLG